MRGTIDSWGQASGFGRAWQFGLAGRQRRRLRRAPAVAAPAPALAKAPPPRPSAARRAEPGPMARRRGDGSRLGPAGRPGKWVPISARPGPGAPPKHHLPGQAPQGAQSRGPWRDGGDDRSRLSAAAQLRPGRWVPNSARPGTRRLPEAPPPRPSAARRAEPGSMAPRWGQWIPARPCGPAPISARPGPGAGATAASVPAPADCPARP
jgi:hypothetical protein